MNKTRIKMFEKLMFKLKNNLVIVEGKNDKSALQKIGAQNIITIQSYPLERIERLILNHQVNNEEIIVLMDIDKEGDRLSEQIKDLCKGISINPDLRTRVMLSSLLGLKFWENIDKKVDNFIDENY